MSQPNARNASPGGTQSNSERLINVGGSMSSGRSSCGSFDRRFTCVRSELFLKTSFRQQNAHWGHMALWIDHKCIAY